MLDLIALTQDVPASPLGKLALAALSPVVAWISTTLYDGLKQAWNRYDQLPALAHAVLAPLAGYAIGAAAAALGLSVVPDLAGFDATWINGALNALLMAGIFRLEQRWYA